MFQHEIRDRLVAQGVGTYGKNIFLGTKAGIPDGDGPYLSIIETGGSAPSRVHNSPGAHTQRPTAQIVARAKSQIDARTMARSAYAALDGIFNTTLSGTFYQKVTARNEPTDIGVDDKDRARFAFNIEAEKQPS